MSEASVMPEGERFAAAFKGAAYREAQAEPALYSACAEVHLRGSRGDPDGLGERTAGRLVAEIRAKMLRSRVETTTDTRRDRRVERAAEVVDHPRHYPRAWLRWVLRRWPRLGRLVPPPKTRAIETEVAVTEHTTTHTHYHVCPHVRPPEGSRGESIHLAFLAPSGDKDKERFAHHVLAAADLMKPGTSLRHALESSLPYGSDSLGADIRDFLAHAERIRMAMGIK